MRSEKTFLVVVLGLALITAVGCSRNKNTQPVPATTAISPVSQPVVSATAPAPAARRTSNYIK